MTSFWGRHDAVLDVTKLPARFARDLHIPPAQQHVLDAGHFLQEDQPAEVARLMVHFIRQVERPAPSDGGNRSAEKPGPHVV